MADTPLFFPGQVRDTGALLRKVLTLHLQDIYAAPRYLPVKVDEDVVPPPLLHEVRGL